MADAGGVFKRLVVGVGASAGGVEALEELFSTVPEGTHASFLIVLHSTPGQKSSLPQILERRSLLPVVEVNHREPLEPNHIYVPGPHCGLTVIGNDVVCEKIATSEPRPIDTLFDALAAHFGPLSVGIVLSGTGTDGARGAAAIKRSGGRVIVQDPTTARYPQMPSHVADSCEVDQHLPPAAVADALAIYAEAPPLLQRAPLTDLPAEPLQEVFSLLRRFTKHDFSRYKLSTISRRVQRRMQVHGCPTIESYVRLLQAAPSEIDQLFKELLINVTSFFRDPEAYEVLSTQILPSLLQECTSEQGFRAWIAGCSTGEEAYSVAMAVRECVEKLPQGLAVQIFATDLDKEAIEAARQGTFAATIEHDISPNRLERFFSKTEAGYRIHKDVRDMVVFAQQNLIADPPFTNLDFLSCRNLLIYLDGDIQQRLIPLFHYSLRPGGVLFLGSSESLGMASSVFEPLDKRWKIFRRTDLRANTAIELSRTLPFETPATRALSLSNVRTAVEQNTAQLAEKVLAQYLLPPSVLMHESGDIVHIHGRTGLFLEPAPGNQRANNIFGMAREGLSLELALAIRQVTKDGSPEVVRSGVRVQSNGHQTTFDLRVRRLTTPQAVCGLFVIAFENARPVAMATPLPERPDESSQSHVAMHARHLENELQHIREMHQSTMEELETTNEELKSSNEELQSTNEELQSANEELETSKEEMHSLNEELNAVNAELEVKVDDLSRINDDMKKLLNSTAIATLFLDRDLHIRRYTAQTTNVIRVISTDIGRPISDLVSCLHYDRLIADAREVLVTLVAKETEVQSTAGSWYLTRILPYRTADNMIDGLVITFVDITTVKDLRAQGERIVSALGRSDTVAFGTDLNMRYVWASGALFGKSQQDVIGRTDGELSSELDEKLRVLKRGVLESGQPTRKVVSLDSHPTQPRFQIYLEPAREQGTICGLIGVLTKVQAEV